MLLLTNHRLMSLLRLGKHFTMTVDKKCISCVCRRASRVNAPASLINIPGLQLTSIKQAHTTGSYNPSKKDNTLMAVCIDLNSLSLNMNMERNSNVFLNCLTVGNKEITDKPRIPGLKYDLPKLPGSCAEITTPTYANQVTSLVTPGTSQIVKITPGVEQPMKHASSTTLRMRHKKMKKHQLKRLRKRMWAAIRKEKFRKRRKKQRIFKAELAKVKKEGEDFDAEIFVKEKLAKARQGGYQLNILEASQWN